MDVRHGDHRDLLVWQKAMRLAVDVHRATAMFPRSEFFGLTSQLRRAAISIPSNLAEGSARRTTPDFLAFVHIRYPISAICFPRQNGQTLGTINTVAMPTTTLNGVPKRM